MKRPNDRSIRWIARAATILITLIAIVYVVQAWHETAPPAVPDYDPLRKFGIVLSCILGVLHIFSTSWIFSQVLDGQSKSFPVLAFLAAQPAKYVPGKIWPLVLHRLILGSKSSTNEIFIANAMVAWVTFATMVGGVTFAWAFKSLNLILALVLTLGIFIIFALPSWILKIFPQSTYTDRIVFLKRFAFPKLMLIYIFIAFLTAAFAWIGFYATAMSYPLPQAISLWGVSVGSVAAGMVSFLPAGLGVREAALVWVGDLITKLHENELVTIAIMTRVWLLVVDLIAGAVGLIGLAIRRDSD